MRFEQDKLQVDGSCTEVEVTFVNAGTPPSVNMKHDWVLTRTDDVAKVAAAGLRAGAANDYQPAGDQRIVAATKLVAGGDRATVRFSTAQLAPGEHYTYFCSVPGHFAVMQGDFELRQDTTRATAKLEK